jgi:hypothetical protein
VFALPVTPNYVVSHQWTRELRKWGRGRIAAVYFRVPDEELVSVGHYNRPHEKMTAAQAVATIMHQGHQALGYEVILAHRISREAIIRTRLISSRIGWRHCPDAHGRLLYPVRGQYNSQRLRAKFEQKR